MKHYIRQKTDNSIQYTRHLIHKPRSIVLSKGHLTRNTFKSNIFMLINKLIVKFYVHGSLGVLQSWYLAYWWVSNCFFHELSYVKSLDFGPTFFVVIFNVICLTINNLSGILDTTDTSFVHPCLHTRGNMNASCSCMASGLENSTEHILTAFILFHSSLSLPSRIIQLML